MPGKRIVTAPNGERWQVGQRIRFAVKGWRRSRRAIGALAGTIATTGPPSALPEATPVPAER